MRCLRSKRFSIVTLSVNQTVMHEGSFVFARLTVVHHKLKLQMSVYNTLQVLEISLTDTTPLEDLFNKSNLNIDKELDGFYEPTLFDF